jgi:adenosylmethionine-8-amino-7-oxononanoate aminotransferase
MSWVEEGWPHVWLPYTAMGAELSPLPVVSSQGSRLTLADGRELIDGLASWWTSCHGYSHPHILAALHRQIDALPHVMFGGLLHEPGLTLAKRLCNLLPGDLTRVFFSDSGSVAIEVALKNAVQYHANLDKPERNRFIGFKNGYHGDTLGAMAVGDSAGGMHSALWDYIPSQTILDLPTSSEELADFDSLLARERGYLAGVIIEPLVQGAGGMRFYAPEILAGIAAACAKHGVLLIADEVMTGFGRTGQMFACQAAEIVPDIICLSKALTGGTIGLAATVVKAEIFAAFDSPDFAKALMHGPSYMANPLACAAANASLDLFEREPRLAQVKAIETQLREELEPCRKLPGVLDVRALGAIGVVQLETMRVLPWLRRRFPEKGVFLRPFADIVYLTPAFTIPPNELSRLTSSIFDVLSEWGRKEIIA